MKSPSLANVKLASPKTWLVVWPPHSKQIIHRDLCGDNVLLKLTQPVPIAKISDFGMSRLYDPSKLSHTLTAVGHRMGYLPLEAIRLDKENYDNSVDVFSLGAIMV